MRHRGALACLMALAGSIGPQKTDAAPGRTPKAPAAPARLPALNPTDFRYDILPLLHQSGCASAYCHGSATGRGGFKLSLFASDPRADYDAIVHDRGGRRLDFASPMRSLLLRKPTRELRHGGGRRMQIDDPAHRRLVAWIREGAPYQASEPRRAPTLRATRSDEGRMQVFAIFPAANPLGKASQTAAPSERDVTSLCTFSSTDESVVQVSPTGQLTIRGPGAARVFARYDSLQTWLEVTQRFATPPSGTSKPDAPSSESSATPAFDRIWRQRLDELGLGAAPPAPSWQLARRLYLDLVGRLPTPPELQSFQALPASDRVRKTAAKLVAAKEFAIVFGRHLATWLEIPLRPPARRSPQTAMFSAVHQSVVADVARGETTAAIARRLLVDDLELLHRFADPRDRAELASRAFLGIRIGCARCHNSPVDAWEQADHLGFAALFASPRPAPGGGTQPGVLFGPDGLPVAPRVLPLRSHDPTPPRPNRGLPARRAAFLLDSQHGQFARNIANRMVAALLGRGLVEPVDDHRPTNPSPHAALLEHLAKRFPTGDLRGLALCIVSSALYQSSSRPSTDARQPVGFRVKFLARREARPLRPHTFRRAIEKALDVKIGTPLPISPLARQLALLNGDVLHGSIARSPVVETLGQLAGTPDDLARSLFPLLLSRPPRSQELEALRTSSDPAATAQRLAFAILAGREFGSIR